MIRKYLASGIVEPKYPLRHSVSKLDPFAGTLSTWLKREAGRNRKRWQSLKMLHRDLVGLGFDGSYDRVAAFARDWRQQQREADNRASRSTMTTRLLNKYCITTFPLRLPCGDAAINQQVCTGHV